MSYIRLSTNLASGPRQSPKPFNAFSDSPPTYLGAALQSSADEAALIVALNAPFNKLNTYGHISFTSFKRSVTHKPDAYIHATGRKKLT